MPKFAKGSVEAKEYMASIRTKKKGQGYIYPTGSAYYGTPKKNMVGEYTDTMGNPIVETNMYGNPLSSQEKAWKNYSDSVMAHNAYRISQGQQGYGGFFENIGRAFKQTWERPATQSEKAILRPIFDTQRVLTDNVITPIAPPIGKLAGAQRQFFENKYLG